MFDIITPFSMTGSRPDPGGFLPEARTGAREAAAHMKDLAERFAELRNAIMRLSRTRFPWTQNWLNRSVQGGPEHDR